MRGSCGSPAVCVSTCRLNSVAVFIIDLLLQGREGKGSKRGDWPGGGGATAGGGEQRRKHGTREQPVHVSQVQLRLIRGAAARLPSITQRECQSLC